MPIEWAVPAVAVLLVIWGVILRRRMAALQQVAVQAWAKTDEAIRRRHDLVTRLVEAVKGRVARDRRSLDGVLKARALAASQQAPAGIGKAEAGLTAAIGKVFEVIDEDPGLKADPGIQRLQAEFSAIEGRILRCAGVFNDAAREFNDVRMALPGAVLASVIRFDLLEYYAVVEAKPETLRTAPVRL